MKISIDSTLERLQEAELEKIKRQFLDEAFRGHPGDAELFEFEDIDRQCLVYPDGQFTIYGFFHYLGESFRIHATFYDGRKPWVSVITYSECYEFRSVRDAVSFCKQFRQTPDPGYAELQERCFKDIETPAWEIIKGQFAGLDPDDRVQMSVEGYQLSQHYTPQRFNTLHVEFRYKEIPIWMSSSLYEEDPSYRDVNGTVEFKVQYRMIRRLCSLAEAVAFLKTDPKYVEPLSKYEEEHPDAGTAREGREHCCRIVDMTGGESRS